jgi:hypothetical protein
MRRWTWEASTANSPSSWQLMAGIVADLQAGSRVITTAQAAARADPSAWAGPPIREMPTHLGSTQGRSSQAASRQSLPAPPGPVERILIELDVTSKPDLEQAAAIDRGRNYCEAFAAGP